MRIFIPMLGFGKAGGHRVLSSFATEWMKLGHEVIFLCPKDYHDVYYPTTARVEYLATFYSMLPSGLRKKILRDVFGLIALFFALMKRAGRGDVIVANRDLTAFPTRATAFLKRSKGVYYIQAYEPDFYEFNNPVLRKIAQAISASTYSLKLLRIVNAPLYTNYGRLRSIRIAPPGVDLAVFHPKTSHQHPDDRALTIGCIGRAQIWKGTKDVIEAVQILRDKGLMIRLKVAFHLPAEFAHLEWIDFVQPHGDSKLADFYRSCDFFIAAGKIQYGAFHYPAAESIAVETPLISSPYFPASSENSYIFDECNPLAIAAVIQKALNDDGASRLARIQNGGRAIRRMSWELAADNFLKQLN